MFCLVQDFFCIDTIIYLPWLGTNLIHGEKCVISRDVSENMPSFMENSRAPQTLFRGAMLMQTKKSVE